MSSARVFLPAELDAFVESFSGFRFNRECFIKDVELCDRKSAQVRMKRFLSRYPTLGPWLEEFAQVVSECLPGAVIDVAPMILPNESEYQRYKEREKAYYGKGSDTVYPKVEELWILTCWEGYGNHFPESSHDRVREWRKQNSCRQPAGLHVRNYHWA